MLKDVKFSPALPNEKLRVSIEGHAGKANKIHILLEGEHPIFAAFAPGRGVYEEVVDEAALSRAERPRERAVVRQPNRRRAVGPAHDQPLHHMVAIVQPAPHSLDRLRAQLEAVRPPIRAEQRRPLVVIADSNGCDHPGPRLRQTTRKLGVSPAH